MKNLFHKNVLLIILFVATAGYVEAQSSYTLNGSLGLDTVPEHTLDVNGDGHFKGELLLDDDLRMMKLASGDILIERLVYFDEDGRMHRLGGDGARDIEEYIHNLPCKYVDVEGVPMPVVYWKTNPGKITAYDEVCGAPNVGIGTHYPEARLDVRGNTYISENLGLGTINEEEARLVIRSSGSGILVRTTDGAVDKDVFEVKTNGRIATKGMDAEQHALSIKNEGSDEENVIITGDGRTRLSGMSVSSDALVIQNNESLQPNVVIKGNGHIQQNVSGEWNDHVISIKDQDTEDEVFFVQKNGELFIKELEPENYAIAIQNNISNNHNVIIQSNGRTTLRGMDLEDNALYVENDAGVEAMNLKGNGSMRLNFSGSNNTSRVFRIQNENFDGDDVFRITGEGKVWATAVHVRLKEDFPFPDYVFEPGYDLMPLEKLRRHIADHQRLPNMPSAEEVERNGVDLGEMNRLLVEKVEELTLYVLQLEERLKTVEAK